MLTLYIAFKIAQLGLIFAFICPAPFLWVYDRVHGEIAMRRIRRQIGMSR